MMQKIYEKISIITKIFVIVILVTNGKNVFGAFLCLCNKNSQESNNRKKIKECNKKRDLIFSMGEKKNELTRCIKDTNYKWTLELLASKKNCIKIAKLSIEERKEEPSLISYNWELIALNPGKAVLKLRYVVEEKVIDTQEINVTVE